MRVAAFPITRVAATTTLGTVPMEPDLPATGVSGEQFPDVLFKRVIANREQHHGCPVRGIGSNQFE